MKLPDFTPGSQADKEEGNTNRYQYGDGKSYQEAKAQTMYHFLPPANL